MEEQEVLSLTLTGLISSATNFWFHSFPLAQTSHLYNRIVGLGKWQQRVTS